MLLNRTLRPVVVALALVTTFASAARAGNKEQCLDAYETAQRARKKGHLREAQSELVRCAAPQCPAFITKECTRWASEVEAELPTVVFVANDGAGSDLSDVSVEVDGQAVAKRLDGAPVPLDPGAHRVKYAWNGKTLELAIVLAAGERNRRVEGTFPAPARARGDARVSESQPAGGGIPVASLVLGGVALAGGASFAVFAILGKGKESCAPHCARSDVDALRRDYLIADVSWAVGAAAAVAAGIVWWTQPAPSRPSTSFMLVPRADGVAVGARGAF